MKVREREPWRILFVNGLRVFDLYDLMDRAGTYTFRLTKRYINIPLTAAATGVLGHEVGGEAFDWQKLIYLPLLITAGICAAGMALKVPNLLSAAKRDFARLQGQVNMMQLKRHQRRHHARVLWDRHFQHHTRERFSEEEIAAAERDYGERHERLVRELEAGLSDASVDHLELENLKGSERREAIRKLAEAMEYVTPTSPGVERCRSAFERTLRYSLHSEESQRGTQERSGYDFSAYKTWLRQTFFDHAQPPLSAHLQTDYRLGCVRAQLRRDGVRHTPRVRERWFAFPGLSQRFWHANTIRKVNLKVGAALSWLSRKHRCGLNVQAILWPGNWRRAAFQVKAADGSVLGEELRAVARRIMREVYGSNRRAALLMLDRATLNNFIQTKGLRVLADYAYCVGEGVEPGYLEDLRNLGCGGELLAEHERFVADARAAMREFTGWLGKNHPDRLEDPVGMAVLRDGYHRNWQGLREAVPGSAGGHNLYGFTFWRCWRRGEWMGGDADRLVAELGRDETRTVFREERDAIRMYDALAHLEQDTYADLILKLAEFDGDAR